MEICHYLEIDEDNGNIYNYLKHIIHSHSDGIGYDTYYEKIHYMPLDAKTFLLKISEDKKNELLENNVYIKSCNTI